MPSRFRAAAAVEDLRPIGDRAGG